MGKNGNGGFSLFCCFIAFGVAAVIAFITYLLPLVSDSITIGSEAMNIMDIIFNVAALVGLTFGALAFAGRRGMLIKVLTGVFVLVFVVAIILHIVVIA